MTTVLPHGVIAWGGSLGNPAVEVWTNVLAWYPADDHGIDDVIELGLAGEQEQMDGLALAIKNWFLANDGASAGGGLTAKGSYISPSANLEWVKFNIVGTDGKYLFSPNTFTYPAPIPGVYMSGPDGQSLPIWEQSYCITMRTTTPRAKRGGHGRIYPPVCGIGPAVNSPYAPTYMAEQMRNNFVGLLDNINDGMYDTYDTSGIAEHHAGNVSIVSVVPTRGPNLGAPALITPVLNVEVDLVADIQHRRTNRVVRRAVDQVEVSIHLS